MTHARGTVPSGLAVLAVLVTACASVRRADDWHERLAAPPADGLGAGPFGALDPAGVWGLGDHVAYTIAIDDGERTARFVFELTTVALPPPQALVDAHPVHGRILTRTAAPHVYSGGCFGDGRARVRARQRGEDGTDCGGELDALLLAHWHADSLPRGPGLGVEELFFALLGLDCMHAELLRVLRPPSAWSIGARMGRIDVALDWPPVDRLPVEQMSTPFGVLPVLWRPFTITANGTPALDGRIQFTWKHSPLLLAAGALRVEAWHPDDAARRVTLRLDRAVRGTPPDAPDPDDLGFGLRRGMSVADAARAFGAADVEPRERGLLADGVEVEVALLVGGKLPVHVVATPGGLTYATWRIELVHSFLKQRGYVARDRAE